MPHDAPGFSPHHSGRSMKCHTPRRTDPGESRPFSSWERESLRKLVDGLPHHRYERALRHLDRIQAPRVDQGWWVALHEREDRFEMPGILPGIRTRCTCAQTESPCHHVLALALAVLEVAGGEDLRQPRIPDAGSRPSPSLLDQLPVRRGMLPLRCLRLNVVASGLQLEIPVVYPWVGEIDRQAERLVTCTRDDGTLLDLERSAEEEAQLEEDLDADLEALGVDIEGRAGHARILSIEGRSATFPSWLVEALRPRGWSFEDPRRMNRQMRRIGSFGDGATASGIDWFDLDAPVEFDEFQLPLSTLVENRGFATLPDGSLAELPRQLLRRIEEMRRLQAMLRNPPEGESSPPPSEVPSGPAWRDTLANALDERSLSIPAPRGLVGTLRPWQLDGFRWLVSMRDRGLGGILADDMGVGKTLQVISLLCHIFETESDAGPAMVVAPAQVVDNWVAEIRRFAPGLRILLHHGPGRAKALPQGVRNPDVIVTTYGILGQDIDLLADIRFSAAILDESQAIRSRSTRAHRAALRLQAVQRLCLTGTPIENRFDDLMAQFDFLAPGLFPRPEPGRGLLPDQIDMAQWNRLTAPFWFRRGREEVLPELPSCEHTTEIVPMDPTQERLYNRHFLEIRKQDLASRRWSGREARRRFDALTALLRLRQIACAPALARQRGPSAKLERLVAMLGERIARGRPCLVFSSFTGFLDLVQERLRREGMDHLRMDGSTPRAERTRRIRAFQEGRSPVFLVSLKAGNAGINLTRARSVFFLDPWWNPAVENQAIARAHRMGQTGAVEVIRLIARGTVEEKVLRLSAGKLGMLEGLFSGRRGGAAITPELYEELLGGAT